MKTIKLYAALAVLSLLTTPLMAVPGIINYQGRVAAGGTLFTGNGSFRFALVDSPVTTTHWSNDGTSVAGTAPTDAVVLAVKDGLYSVALGDTAIPNMTTAIPASIFASNDDVRLRVWFDDGVNGSQLLEPDQRITAVAYALAAGTSGGGGGGGNAGRIAIDSLPFTITASGSYFLEGSLVGSSGNAGIIVQANDVTIDLNGFTLTGAAGTLDGIQIDAVSRVRVTNGIIRGWGDDGIDGSAGTDGDFSHVTASNNGGDGILMGNRSCVRLCKLNSNGEDGLQTADDATVSHNLCQGNTAQGMRIAGNDGVIQHNQTRKNGTGFEVTGTGNRIHNNYTIGNGSSANSNQILTAFDNDYDLLISDIPELLDQPCNARLTGNVINTTTNGDGITIDHNNVTLDLGGFTIIGSGRTDATIQAQYLGGSSVSTTEIADYLTGPTSDDGIVVQGSHENITIRNGSVVAWGGDGINALNADLSLFEKLHVAFNGGDGLVADFNCLIVNCTAYACGLDGLEGDDGTVIRGCTARLCGDNGIQTSEGCTVTDCASFDNESDGIDVAAGSVVTGCSATDNGIFGFDIALGGNATNCTAYDNGNLGTLTTTTPFDPNDPLNTGVTTGSASGFDMASACHLSDCIASLNNGHGVRTFANSRIVNCKFHENDVDGIRISSTDSQVEGNNCTDNDQVGIKVTSSGGFVVRNRCAGNLANYAIITTTAFGPIVDVTGVGDISGVLNADNPFANFEF